MSRRPDPARAAQNQQTIKNLLKLEPNKTCADCKRNKHPRWASWNLGIFICIRCSGIHRGMGTHISRVKSVDLDAWTDEQLQSVLKWGNGRANKYWEAKLTPGHVPSDSKIENFIRTKYESKRWAMDGPIPDPATLGSDDDVPLAVVQEKAKLERSASQRAPVASQPPVRRQPQQSVNFFDDDNTINPPARPSTTDPPAVARPPPPANAQPAAPKPQAKPADSLLGLDFFGSTQSTPTSRPGSTGPAAGSQAGMSRPDLKQSILSLYATAPKPQPAQHERTSSIASATQSNVGSLTDAFSGLTFPTNSSASPPPPKPQADAFAGLTGFGAPQSPPAASKVTSPTGSLFDSIASNTSPSKPNAGRTASVSSNGWGSFSSPNTTSQQKQQPPPASASNDLLFDLSAPAAPSQPRSPPVSQPSMSSAFNLSAPAPQPAQKAAPTTSTSNVTSAFSAASSMDPWGGNAWSTPDPAPAAPAAITTATTTTTATITSTSSTANPVTSPLADSMRMPDTLTSKDIGAGWGAAPAAKPAAATVAPDDDFGGWTSAAPVSSSGGNKPAVGGFGGGNDDLFSNVWE
ncbi:putative protein C824,09c [Talaromyces islandicus]|uniref:Arf-GAP domain-containing protein n=1 Tax=Talaromyces islandicus TaxID=28573 RepID=A0A0U1LP82_TALIS|nr:putative protein C824,09c [Talaromyces islandicus]